MLAIVIAGEVIATVDEEICGRLGIRAEVIAVEVAAAVNDARDSLEAQVERLSK